MNITNVLIENYDNFYLSLIVKKEFFFYNFAATLRFCILF